jgi:hypothetical protein
MSQVGETVTSAIRRGFRYHLSNPTKHQWLSMEIVAAATRKGLPTYCSPTTTRITQSQACAEPFNAILLRAPCLARFPYWKRRPSI